jgi:hypothetical protein
MWTKVLALGLLTLALPRVLHGQSAPLLPPQVQHLSVKPPSRAALIPVWEAAPIDVRPPLALNDEGVRDAAVEKKRIARYMLAGAVVGAVVGYTVHEAIPGARVECDGDRHLFCPLIPYVYTVFGAGVGANVGALIASIRESR